MNPVKGEDLFRNRCEDATITIRHPQVNCNIFMYVFVVKVL